MQEAVQPRKWPNSDDSVIGSKIDKCPKNQLEQNLEGVKFQKRSKLVDINISLESFETDFK